MRKILRCISPCLFLLALPAWADLPCSALLTGASNALAGPRGALVRQAALSLSSQISHALVDPSLALQPAFQARLRNIVTLGNQASQALLLELGGALVDTEEDPASSTYRQLFENMAHQIAATMAHAQEYAELLPALVHDPLALQVASEDLKENLATVLPERNKVWEVNISLHDEHPLLGKTYALDNDMGYLGKSLGNLSPDEALAAAMKLESQRQDLLTQTTAHLTKLTESTEDTQAITIHADVENTLVYAAEHLALVKNILEMARHETNPRHQAGLMAAARAVCAESLFEHDSAVDLADLAAEIYIRAYRLAMNSDHSTLFVPDVVALVSHLSPSPLLQGTLAPDSN